MYNLCQILLIVHSLFNFFISPFINNVISFRDCKAFPLLSFSKALFSSEGIQSMLYFSLKSQDQALFFFCFLHISSFLFHPSKMCLPSVSKSISQRLPTIWHPFLLESMFPTRKVSHSTSLSLFFNSLFKTSVIEKNRENKIHRHNTNEVYRSFQRSTSNNACRTLTENHNITLHYEI